MSGFDAIQPYNALPALPPTAYDPNTDLDLARALIPARSALAELKGVSRSLPNPVLLLDLVALREGQASSAIEDIVTTQDELYRALAEGALFASPSDRRIPEGSPVKEVVNYRRAMYTGLESLRSRPVINTTLCTDVVREIKSATTDVRTQPGTRIGRSDGTTIYTPPEGERHLRDLLAAWERYLNEGYLTLEHDPLVAMALAHYQFEAIHPYPDGNGRTGRIVNVLHLVNAGLLASPILYLSRYINANREAYYRGLRGVTERAEWSTWVRYMVRGVEVTAMQTIEDIHGIGQQMAHALTEIREALGDNVPAERLRDLAFRNAYVKISMLERAGIAKRQTASKYLYALTAEGGGPDFLRAERRGREVYFRNHRLLELLGRG